MGVDWLTCNYCGENFPDCGHFVSCEECGTTWCCDECASEEGYEEAPDDDSGEPSSCKFCRGEDHSDIVLLNFALEQLGMNREELIEFYNANKQAVKK